MYIPALMEWNLHTVSMQTANPNVVVVLDASGSWGCGAYWGHNRLQLRWDDNMSTSELPIAFKELLHIPVVLAAVTHWVGSGK